MNNISYNVCILYKDCNNWIENQVTTFHKLTEEELVMSVFGLISDNEYYFNDYISKDEKGVWHDSLVNNTFTVRIGILEDTLNFIDLFEEGYHNDGYKAFVNTNFCEITGKECLCLVVEDKIFPGSCSGISVDYLKKFFAKHNL